REGAEMSSALQRAEPMHPQAADRRWIGLAFIALAQLMTALDATIVSIALPWAQRALGASDAERQWVITAYTLAFGGLLLVGGRIADTIGRRRAFLIGLGGFALASVVGGSAQSFLVLLIARAAQGAFAALLAPTALSLLAVTFTQPRERARAFALTARSPEVARRSGFCWAAPSPNAWTGAGASAATCRSRS